LRDSVPIDMILSAVYVLVVAQSSSEVPEGLMNNPVLPNVRWPSTVHTTSLLLLLAQSHAVTQFLKLLNDLLTGSDDNDLRRT